MPSSYVAAELYQGGEYRYAVGLGTDVTYDANYLGRIDMTVDDAGDTQDQLVVSVPGAVLNDGTIDFYLYCIDNLGVGNPVFVGWSDGAESGEANPTPTSLTNALRVEFKAGQPAVEVEIEWEG